MQDISRFMGGNDCVEVESRGTGTSRTWPSTIDAETSVEPQWSHSSQPVEFDALCYLPMFSVRLQSSEGRTPDRSARKSPVVPSTERGASPVEHPGGNVQGSALADASPLNRKVEADNCTNQGRTRRTSQCLRPVFRTPDGRCDGFWGASRVETASKLLFDGEDWSSRRVDSFNKNS